MTPVTCPEEIFSKKRMLIIIIILAIVATGCSYFTFHDSNSSWVSKGLLFLLILGFVLVIIGVFIKEKLPPKLFNFITKAQNFFKILSFITREIVPNRVGILICSVLLILLVGMGQARELLLLLSESKLMPPLFFSLLSVLALSSWYWTRFAYQENIDLIEKKNFFHTTYKAHVKTNDCDKNYVRGVLPKIFGFFIILIPTFFILGLYLENVKEHGLWVKVGTGIMYFALLIIGYAFVKIGFYNFIKALINKKKWIIWTALFLIIILTIIPVIRSKGVMYSPRKIPFLYLSGGVICLLYFMFASLEIDKKLANIKFIPIKANLNVMQKGTFIAALLLIILFTYYNLFPLQWDINGLTVLLGGLIAYTFLAYLMFIIGGRNKLPILTIVLIGGTLYSYKFSPKSDLHNVRLTHATIEPDSRDNINQYIMKWFADEDRKKQIAAYQKETEKPYPIIFVSSEGGGSRAAFWTLLVHDALEKNIPNYYQHLFSLSGASGGNTGNSFYLAYKDYIRQNTPETAIMAEKVFKNDFISGDIGMLFGRDALQSTFATSIGNDRAEFLQQKWENAFAIANNEKQDWRDNPLKRDFLSFWYDKAGVMKMQHPLFLLHTTHVQSGDHATLSPVKLADFIPQNMDLLKQINDSMAIPTGTIDTLKGVPLSSGALMNSRFPIICPSGKIPNVGNFVDAGYYDNFGAAESRAAMNAVIDYLERDSLLNRKEFKIMHIVIRNGLPTEDDDLVKQTVMDTSTAISGKSAKSKDIEDLYVYTSVRTNLVSKQGTLEMYKRYESVHESVVPIIAFTGAAFAHPNRELAESEYVSDITYYFDLRRTKVASEDGIVTPILPLSRHLSFLARKSMKACIKNLIDDKNLQRKLDKDFILRTKDTH